MQPRQWQIVFHLHADNSATARIHVDGRLLLPSCDGLPAEETLGYIAAALVDHHPVDQLALRAQGAAGAIRSIRLMDSASAQTWLRARAKEQAVALGPNPEGEKVEGEGAHSGLRLAVKQDDEQVASSARKGSTS